MIRVHGTVAREIGVAIVTGRLRPGHVLDGEIEASLQRKVSRTTYREAIRILSAKGLIQSRPRTGTRVSEMGSWNLLDPDVLAWLFSGVPSPAVLHGLFELRTIVEPAHSGTSGGNAARARCHDSPHAQQARMPRS